MAQAESDEAMSGVGNYRHTGIAHQGHVEALLELDNEFGSAG